MAWLSTAVNTLLHSAHVCTTKMHGHYWLIYLQNASLISVFLHKLPPMHCHYMSHSRQIGISELLRLKAYAHLTQNVSSSLLEHALVHQCLDQLSWDWLTRTPRRWLRGFPQSAWRPALHRSSASPWGSAPPDCTWGSCSQAPGVYEDWWHHREKHQRSRQWDHRRNWGPPCPHDTHISHSLLVQSCT